MLFLYQQLFGQKMIKYYLIQKGLIDLFIFVYFIKFYFFYRISMNDNNFKLHINDIALNDRGHYQCQAENLVGRSQQVFNVQVFSNKY
jgi:hypothetical protein